MQFATLFDAALIVAGLVKRCGQNALVEAGPSKTATPLRGRHGSVPLTGQSQPVASAASALWAGLPSTATPRGDLRGHTRFLYDICCTPLTCRGCLTGTNVSHGSLLQPTGCRGSAPHASIADTRRREQPGLTVLHCEARSCLLKLTSAVRSAVNLCSARASTCNSLRQLLRLPVTGHTSTSPAAAMAPSTHVVTLSHISIGSCSVHLNTRCKSCCKAPNCDRLTECGVLT